MPMPLMGKKAPTPQELYKARKQREEEERNVLLPPGLVNHGNTCFMNSVLQGLIATPMLADLLRFNLPESYLPISSRRSPGLTNGLGLAGKWDQKWAKGMPLGDTFVLSMAKAWEVQEKKERINLSPKELLSTLGKKYDQYLDFRQQDAHELLRHLLDAMRMEELDVIKTRQPPPPKVKRKRRRKATNIESSIASIADSESQEPSTSKQIPEEERLTSFVDMVFGGQLASILVCEKCKKISCTYEDFDDLSLPIKAEDYEKIRRRDRLKGFAKKLKLDFSGAQPRSSSTPASPSRTSIDPEKLFERTSIPDERRRSLDASNVILAESTEVEQTEVRSSETITGLNEDGKEFPQVEVLEVKGDGRSKIDDEVKKEKSKRRGRGEEEGWVKLSRHISMKLGKKGRSKDSRKAKGKDSDNIHSPSTSPATVESSALTSRVASTGAISSSAPLPTPPIVHFEATDSQQTSANSASPVPAFSFAPRPPISRAHSASPSLVTGMEDRRSASPLLRPKSPQPPKQSSDEAGYLRRLLSDIPSSTSSPFANIFRGAGSGTSDLVGGNGNSWPKLGGVQSVEDCLRMFTSVEVLDGDNKYGCRRCWKMSNGQYVERGRSAGKRVPDEKEEQVEDSSDDSSDDDDEEIADNAVSAPLPNGSSLPTPSVQKREASPALTASTSGSPLMSSVELFDNVSVSSAPTTMLTAASESLNGSDTNRLVVPPISFVASESNLMSKGPPIPVISMTAAEPESTSHSTASSSPTDEHDPSTIRTNTVLPHSPSHDSLRLPEPRSQHVRRPAEQRLGETLGGDDSSNPTSEESEDDLDSDVDISTSVQSETSSAASREGSPPDDSKRATTSPSLAPAVPSVVAKVNAKPKEKPRVKEVIFRRAYKRYLIAKPPPVLVIHLKRFQQVGTSLMYSSFFSNLKKLDDPVSFPEYLDLTPFLLPRKEDYGLAPASPSKGKEKCQYRLYAVVVHIGNMLGGHYIAYTAVPDAASDTEHRCPVVLNPNADQPSQGRGEHDAPSDNSTLAVPRPPNSRTTSFESSANPKLTSTHSSRKWCYISDTVVKLTTLEEVMKSKAYICMYERI